MRIRTVKPSFWSHPVMALQPDTVRIAAIGLLNMADDEGFFACQINQVRSALWPLDEDSSNARRALAQLAKIGFIEVRYVESFGYDIGRVVTFQKHQRIDRPTPSKLKTYWKSATRRTLDERSTNDPAGKEGKGKEVNREEEEDACARNSPLNGTPLPGQKNPVSLRAEQVARIVTAYPKRVEQAEAERIVAEWLDRGEEAAEMLAGTLAIAEAIARAPSGARNKYVPSPVRFFAGKRWRDDPAVWEDRLKPEAPLAPRPPSETAQRLSRKEELERLFELYHHHPCNPKNPGGHFPERLTAAQWADWDQLGGKISLLE